MILKLFRNSHYQNVLHKVFKKYSLYYNVTFFRLSVTIGHRITKNYPPSFPYNLITVGLSTFDLNINLKL